MKVQFIFAYVITNKKEREIIRMLYTKNEFKKALDAYLELEKESSVPIRLSVQMLGSVLDNSEDFILMERGQLEDFPF